MVSALTGFDPSHQNAQADNLQSTVSIDFSDNPDMFEAFYEKYSGKQNAWKFNGKVATLVW